ncbi:hypothetical protein BSLG_005872 [Batrachochytrium salamandrivorans]|nr:hypothetical protein BSLG_005872 [Batrachochytrium salamandrivorans]
MMQQKDIVRSSHDNTTDLTKAGSQSKGSFKFGVSSKSTDENSENNNSTSSASPKQEQSDSAQLHEFLKREGHRINSAEKFFGRQSRSAINGVLLFGPPGTGKTMLAKAVAKSSGAKFMNVALSNVLDKYVGEGEKILSSNNNGVIVLGATNRPFDLDDAILRRMPRRILIDLLSEESASILTRLLMDELLITVSISHFCKTPTALYSGSDLKNLCIAAALARVKESVVDPSSNRYSQTKLQRYKWQFTKIKKTGIFFTESEPLTSAHFEVAFAEVPPSLTDEMQTLVELRKWDKQFGDGSARHNAKKTRGWGFDC